jgi:hypothetical protein
MNMESKMLECDCDNCKSIRDKIDELKINLKEHNCLYCGISLNQHNDLNDRINGCSIKIIKKN